METKIKVGDKVRIIPKVWDDEKKEYTFEGNENHVLYKKVGTVRSLGVIPTVYIKTNTNAGKWWYGVDYDEMELVPEDTELSIL